VSATTTVKARSFDNVGNTEAVVTQAVQIDGTAPVTTVSCNNAACQSSAYFASVSVTLASTDNGGGSGLSSTHYTTNGTDPVLTSPTYSTALTLTATTTLKFRSWDVAGNVEAVQSQLIQVTPDSPPVASLAVSPASGVAPFVVTADASASSDSDPTPIASYTFNWGDGSTVVTQTGATASHTYSRTGTFTVTMTATDTANLKTSTTKQIVSKNNLINNSTFESNVSGWTTNTGSVQLNRVSGGHSGSFAARVLNSGTSANTCTLDDSPNAVGKTSSGTYTATLWVKGVTAGATLSLRLRELVGSTTVGSATATVVLTTSWQLVTVQYAVTRPSTSALDLNATVNNVAASATAFLADDATLSLG
jgi:PKD repeat protein